MKKKTTIFSIFLIIILAGILVIKWKVEHGVKYFDFVEKNIHHILYPNQETLEQVVTHSLEGATGDYAVAITDLKDKDEYYVNEHKQYTSGSLYKLWVMAAAYQQIQKGSLKKNEVLQDEIADINKTFNIASESAELKEGEISFTVQEALRQMITISHNYAALMLTQRIGTDAVEKFIKDNGFIESSFGDSTELPSTTVHDMNLFFNKLYNGELANKMYTDEMIGLLKDQQKNNKLPRFLPDDIVVAHKTGELDMYTHDAGIVYLNERPYIIVVLSESEYPPGAEERIGKISQAVYNYFLTD